MESEKGQSTTEFALVAAVIALLTISVFTLLSNFWRMFAIGWAERAASSLSVSVTSQEDVAPVVEELWRI